MLKSIGGYEGYFVSDKGQVYCNLGKGNRDHAKTVPLYEIKPRLTKNGYARIYARQTETGKRKDLYVHRLVADAFIENPESKRYVNHKNCIRDDNRKANLEWSTAAENTEYTSKMGHVLRDSMGRYVSNFCYGM